jgi:hypothetical protein
MPITGIIPPRPGAAIAPVRLRSARAGLRRPSPTRASRIEIDAARSESPTFGGYSWPEVGQYEKVVGKAYGEVNPRDRQNRVIVDIEFAPRNARGNVEYAFNFYILKPIDLSKGADKMMYEPPNRGGRPGPRSGGSGRQRPGNDHRPGGWPIRSMPRATPWRGAVEDLELDTFNATASFPSWSRRLTSPDRLTFHVGGIVGRSR